MRTSGWRRPALIAASVVLHGVVLGALSLRALSLDAPVAVDRPTILIEIEPRPLLPFETPRVVQPPAAVQPVTSSGAPVVMPRPRLPDEEDALRPVPRLAVPVPGAPAPPSALETWRLRPEGMADAVARTLRTGVPGCRMARANLSAAEQAMCDERFNAAAARARPIEGTNDPARDARFAREGRRALALYESRRAPAGTAVGVVGPADCPGSNLGTGCAGAHLPPVPGVDMRQGADSLVRVPSNKLRDPP
jgi:hypothetical protein